MPAESIEMEAVRVSNRPKKNFCTQAISIHHNSQQMEPTDKKISAAFPKSLPDNVLFHPLSLDSYKKRELSVISTSSPTPLMSILDNPALKIPKALHSYGNNKTKEESKSPAPNASNALINNSNLSAFASQCNIADEPNGPIAVERYTIRFSCSPSENTPSPIDKISRSDLRDSAQNVLEISSPVSSSPEYKTPPPEIFLTESEIWYKAVCFRENINSLFLSQKKRPFVMTEATKIKLDTNELCNIFQIVGDLIKTIPENQKIAFLIKCLTIIQREKETIFDSIINNSDKRRFEENIESILRDFASQLS